MDPDPGYFFKIYWFHLTKKNFQFPIFFSLILMQNFIRHSEIKNFLISLFSIAQIWGWRVTIFFWQFMVDILPLGSVDPHIFTDPDPKHSLALSILTSFMNKIRSLSILKVQLSLSIKIRIVKEQRLPGMKWGPPALVVRWELGKLSENC